MADLGQSFDPSTVPAGDRDFDTIPAGQYQAQIVDSEVVPTKARTGTMLKLTWEIMTGQFERRKVFEQLNIQNASAKAQEIGQRELASICEAIGVGVIKNSDELHFKPVLIRVAIEKQEGFDDKNVVKRVKPLSGNAAPPSRAAAQPAQAANAQPAATPQPQPQQRQATTGSRPWATR